MPTTKKLTVSELVQCRLFDEAIALYKKQRRAAGETDNRVEKIALRLNARRKDLKRKRSADNDAKSLLAELEKLTDSSGFEEVVDGIFGGREKGEVSDSRFVLIAGLRREVMDQAILVLLKTLTRSVTKDRDD